MISLLRENKFSENCHRQLDFFPKTSKQREVSVYDSDISKIIHIIVKLSFGYIYLFPFCVRFLGIEKAIFFTVISTTVIKYFRKLKSKPNIMYTLKS